MNRFHLIVILAVALSLPACDEGERNAEPARTVRKAFETTYKLAEHRATGRSIGRLRVKSNGTSARTCWDLGGRALAKAVMLHRDDTGPLDAVVATFFEPPEPRESRGCVSIDVELAEDIRVRYRRYYVDSHNSDTRRLPKMWAVLVDLS